MGRKFCRYFIIGFIVTTTSVLLAFFCLLSIQYIKISNENFYYFSPGHHARRIRAWRTANLFCRYMITATKDPRTRFVWKKTPNIGSIHLYTRSRSLPDPGKISVPGYKIIGLRHTWLPLSYLDAQADVYEDTLDVEKTNAQKWPKSLPVTLESKEQSQPFTVRSTPPGAMNQRASLYSNVWTTERVANAYQTFHPVAVPVLKWVGITIPDRFAADLDRIDLLPAPAFQDTVLPDSDYPTAICMAAWLPTQTYGNSLSCVLHYRSGKTVNYIVKRNTSLPNLKLFWGLPQSLAKGYELPVAQIRMQAQPLH